MPARFSRIHSVAHYFPAQTLDNEALAALFPEWPADKILAKTGIRVRYICAEDETALDLGVEAARRLFAAQDIDPHSVDALLFCTELPDYALPPNACLAQNLLHLRTDILASDYNLGCSGYVYGLSLAHGLIASGQAQRVLLITAETYSKIMAPQDKSVRTLFGDAASATLVELSARPGIGAFSWYSNGAGARSLIVPQSGSARYKAENRALPPDEDSGRTAENLFMNGPGIFQFTLDIVPPLLAACLEKNAMTLDTVDAVLLHQANRFMLDHLARKCRIPAEKMLLDMEEGGNTVSNTIPVTLSRKLHRGEFQHGQKLLLAGFGVGLSAAATVVEL